MTSLSLLILITACYAAYNLMVKVSGGLAGAASPILATIGLQLAALGVSLIYLLFTLRSGVSVAVPTKALVYAMVAGLCIGLAEVMYFYLFRGVGGGPGMPASVAIPLIVGGTIVISVLIAVTFFNESLDIRQWSGVMLAVTGMLLLVAGPRQ